MGAFYGEVMSANTVRRRRWVFGLAMAGAAVSAVVAYATVPPPSSYPQSPQFRDGRFHNVVPRAESSLVEGVRVWADFLFNKPATTRPDRALPMLTVTRPKVESSWGKASSSMACTRRWAMP